MESQAGRSLLKETLSPGQWQGEPVPESAEGSWGPKLEGSPRSLCPRLFLLQGPPLTWTQQHPGVLIGVPRKK